MGCLFYAKFSNSLTNIVPIKFWQCPKVNLIFPMMASLLKLVVEVSFVHWTMASGNGVNTARIASLLVPYSTYTHIIQWKFGWNSKNFETYQNGDRSQVLSRVPIMPIMCIWISYWHFLSIDTATMMGNFPS